MLSAIALFLAPVALAGVADTGIVRARASAVEFGIDLSNSTSLNASLVWPKDALSLSIIPTVIVFSLTDPNPAVGYGLGGGLTYGHTFRRWSIAATVGGSIGRNNLRLQFAGPTGALPGAPASPTSPTSPEVPAPGAEMPMNPTPQAQFLDEVVWFGAGTGALSATEQLSERITWSQTVGYGQTGSFGSDVGVYPVQSTWTAGTVLGVRVSATDTFSTGAVFQRARTEGFGVQQFLNITETWAHRLSPRTNFSVGGGVSIDLSPIRSQSVLYPTGLATLAHTPDATTSLTATAGVTPAFDRFTGQVDARVNVGFNFTKARRRWFWGADVLSAVSVDQDSPNSLTSVSLGANTGYQLARDFSFSAGLGMILQRFAANPDGLPIWFSFVGFTYAPRQLRL